MGKKISKQLSLGGMYSAGDGGNNPDGTVRLLQNYLPRPNRIATRPPMSYDNLMAVNGMANLDDQANHTARLVAVDATHHIFTKSATYGSETWSSANATTISGNRLSSYATYRGKLYMMFDDGTGLPSGAAVYDGTTVSTSPFNSAIAARIVTTYSERLHLSYPLVTVNPMSSGVPALTLAYDWTGLIGSTNVTSTLITLSTGQKVCRLTPTSTSASACYFMPYSIVFGSNFVGVGVLSASTEQTSVVWLSGLRGVSATYEVPLTIELVIYDTPIRSFSYVVGNIVTTTGFYHRCTTAGTSDSSPVTYASAIGSTTTDGTAVFLCEGSDVAGSSQFNLPNLSEVPNFANYSVSGTIPPHVGNLYVSPRFKFFNDANPAVTTLVGMDISYRDGLTDGDPRKANFGQQLTVGDYEYPFFNKENTSTAVIELEEEVWSDVGIPKEIRRANFYKMQEASGFPTAACVIGGRKLTFKRTAFWQFQAVGSSDIPIRREKLSLGVGCIGPLALDTYEDVVYFIGENDIYAYSIGDAAPTPICGDGMREEIMNKAASSWVEAQTTCNRPLLCIDQAQLIMWVYTQKGKLYAYDLRAKLWSRHQVGDGFGVECMAWNRNTNNFYVAFDSASYGLTRMVYSSQAPDTIDNTATTYPGVKSIVFRPIELSDPARYDAYCEGMQILYASSGGQEVTLEISSNQGASYGNSVDYTPVAVSTDGDFVPMTLDVCESGPSSTLKLTATGDLGEGAWALSPRVTVSLEVMKGEYPVTNPTSGTANL